MNARTHRLAWRTTGLVALALGAWFAPGKAHAGCGDGHVPLRARPDASQPLPRPARPLPPCTGPACSRLPLAPPAVPPAAEPPVEELAALADGIFPIPPRSSRRLDDDLSFRPVRQADSIYHPPR